MYPFGAADTWRTSLRSSPSMSLSEMRRSARSRAKFGAGVNTLVCAAISCSQRAGRIRKDIGLNTTECSPARIGELTPIHNPRSW